MTVYYRDQGDRIRVWRSDWESDSFVEVTQESFSKIAETCVLLCIKIMPSFEQED